MNQNLKRLNLFVVLLSAGLFFSTSTVLAQEEERLSMRLSRDFGYASGTGRIQGAFSLRVTGPESLERVAFFLDDEQIGAVQAAPFHFGFNTDQFAPGAHRMHAVGYTSDGRELRSNTVQAIFVTAAEARAATVRIVIPILVVVAGATLLSAVIPLISRRGKPTIPGAPRKYGMAGGAICPRCGRPFSRNFLSPNLLVGKLERCPYCGKWAIVPAAHPSVLRAAEQAELEAVQAKNQIPKTPTEEKLRKDLDESRYIDL